MTFFDILGPWFWFIVGGVLLVAEIFSPGVFLLWMGLAALVTGALSAFLDLSWQSEVAIFAVLAVVAVLIGRKVYARPGAASDRPFLNRRAESHVGRVFTLEEPITGGVGQVRIDDTVWRIEGPDRPSGSDVKVVAVDGATLKVEAA